ncbi:MAG: hypothetical protein KatS3mg097_520 [Candidatus Parcubacteria bacterium]|nr:MAG: hypothetical protein KatS3mg097_520 [Candidatus Parcubacteria bacterium]
MGTKLREKILNIQSELEILKRVFLKKPDFSIDEKNWKKIRTEIKKLRKELSKKIYAKK